MLETPKLIGKLDSRSVSVKHVTNFAKHIFPNWSRNTQLLTLRQHSFNLKGDYGFLGGNISVSNFMEFLSLTWEVKHILLALCDLKHCCCCEAKKIF